MTLGLLIPAAGASLRMRGRDKLLEPVDGAPLLARQVQACLALRLPLLLTLPPNDAARRAVLPPQPTTDLTVRPLPDASTGLSASLRAGALWAMENGLTGLMIVLPDMPDLTTPDLAKVATLHSAHPRDVIRASTATGHYGHPTLIPSRLLPDLTKLQGDQGARNLLRKNDIIACPLPGNAALTDLDTPEDWAKWRAARGSAT